MAKNLNRDQWDHPHPVVNYRREYRMPQTQEMSVRVVIAAAGKGTRMQEKTNKQYKILNGHPVLAYSLQFFEQLDLVDEIVVVTRKKDLDFCRQKVIDKYNFKKVSAVISGGKERQDSVWAGLQQLGKDTDLVVVHDGARPLLSSPVFHHLLEEAQEWGAAIPGVVSKDTMKMVDRDGFVRQTIDRESVFHIQTPQVFKYEELVSAYQQACEEKFTATDDASLFERYIGRVKVIEGDYKTIKITTPSDLIKVQSFLEDEGGWTWSD
ncbi:MAG: 2-C-methyl-D-erythritol 4-phosphate cytidylyltransferase [Bacillota bacterium]|nr:2-C-methyl-D-erythritol 4-phosphate cytidylyltransferase [Bacillota bacterium]